MGSNVTSQQSNAPNFSTYSQAPPQFMENSATASSRGNRGWGNRGNTSNRDGRGGGTGLVQGGTKRSNNPGRQKPPPKPIHAFVKEQWNPPQKVFDTWIGTKPVPDKPIHYYCCLPNHTTSEFGIRRKDLADGIDRPYHPDRGHLQGGQYNHRVAQRLVKQGKAQNAAQALAQLEQNEQARITQAKAAANQSPSASAASTSNPNNTIAREGTPYAQLQFQQQQFPTNQATSYAQGNYNPHYYTAPANAAAIAPPQHQMFHSTSRI